MWEEALYFDKGKARKRMRWIMKVLSISLFVSTARVEKKGCYLGRGWLRSFLHPFLFFTDLCGLWMQLGFSFSFSLFERKQLGFYMREEGTTAG